MFYHLDGERGMVKESPSRRSSRRKCLKVLGGSVSGIGGILYLTPGNVKADHRTRINIDEVDDQGVDYILRVNEPGMEKDFYANSADTVNNYDTWSEAIGYARGGQDSYTFPSNGEIFYFEADGHGTLRTSLTWGVSTSYNKDVDLYGYHNDGSVQMDYYFDAEYVNWDACNEYNDQDHNGDYAEGHLKDGGKDCWHVDGQLEAMEFDPKGGKIELHR